MSKSLFLDDERLPHEVTWVNMYPNDVDWEVFRDPFLFTDVIKDMEEQPQNLSFDHDIQYYLFDGTEVTGYDTVKKVVDVFFQKDWDINKTRWWFHTQNEIGKENMRFYVSNALKSQRNS